MRKELKKMAIGVAKVNKKEELKQRVELLDTEVSQGKKGLEKRKKKPFFISSDIEFRRLVKEEAKNAVSLEEIRKILSKVDRALSEMVIEERKMVASYLIDSSALMKRYHIEKGSEKVNKLFEESENERIIPEIGR